MFTVRMHRIIKGIGILMEIWYRSLKQFFLRDCWILWIVAPKRFLSDWAFKMKFKVYPHFQLQPVGNLSEWHRHTYIDLKFTRRAHPFPLSSIHHPLSPALCTHSPVSQEVDTQTSCTTPLLVQHNIHTVSSQIHSAGSPTAWTLKDVLHPCSNFMVFLMLVSSNSLACPAANWSTYVCISHARTHPHKK